MVRVPVPDGFERGYVSIRAERGLDADEYYVGDRRADVVVPGDTARSAKVREDGEGRYVGVYEGHADAVRAFFADEYDASYNSEDDDTAAESGTCEVVKSDGEVCGRELPCPYHSED